MTRVHRAGAVLPKPFDVVELSSALSRLAER